MTFPETKLETAPLPTLGDLREALLEVSRLRKEFVALNEQKTQAIRRMIAGFDRDLERIHNRLSLLEAQIEETTRPMAGRLARFEVGAAGSITFTQAAPGSYKPWHCIIQC
jgi:hypothetical protein